MLSSMVLKLPPWCSSSYDVSELTIRSSSCCGTIEFVLRDTIRLTRIGWRDCCTSARGVQYIPCDTE